MGTLDFAPAATAVARVVQEVRDDQLGHPTPCPDFTVADLLDHLHGLCLAFTSAARKDGVAGEPSADGSRLPADWRASIEGRLRTLAEAWADPAAYAGTTMAGPVELPGEIAALVALDEVVVHGWDLARATGQDYAPGDDAVLACLGFAQAFEVPDGAPGDGPFGPPVPVPTAAPALDRLAGATGRDPAWTA